MVENVLSIFSGAGGGVEGFKQAGYNVVGAVDFEEDCIKTLLENHLNTKVMKEDLSSITPKEFSAKYNIRPNNVDVVIGGPPCQGFSLAGKRKKTDSRNTLIDTFISFVDFYGPEYSVMENVLGILTMNTETGGSVVEHIYDEFENIKYTLTHYTLNASEYNVAQNRKRVFFIGSKSGEKIAKPKPTKDNKITVKEVLSIDITDSPNNSSVNSRQSTIDRMKKLKYGESLNRGETPRRLYPNKPAWTITVGGSPPIHPHEPRKLTLREQALIQSFPVEYKFCGLQASVQRQIGNAMPPKMIKEIAKQL